MHVVVRRAGTLLVYTVKPENKDGPLGTLHRDLLLPCGYLPAEENRAPAREPSRRRPVTCASSAVEEDHSSEEGDDEIIPVYRDVQVSAIPENQDPTIPTVQNTHHADSPDVCPNVHPVDDQNVGSTPELDKPPDKSYSTPDDPLTHKLYVHQGDAETEYLPTEVVTPLERVDDAEYPAKESNLPDNEYIQNEQLTLPLDLSKCNEDKDDAGNGEPTKEGKDETAGFETPSTEETNIPVRRSERNHHPAQRLTYPELGNPLVTVVKSFLQDQSSLGR